MRRVILSLFIVLFFAGVAPCQPVAQTSQLAEADELEAKVISLYREGKLKQALPIAKRVVDLRSSASNSALAESLYNLATIYYDLFDLRAALPLYKKALEVNEAVLPGDLSNAKLLDRIGRTYHLQRDDGNAIESYKRSLAIREKSLGPQHPDVIRTVFTLSLLATSSGQDEEAQELYERLAQSKPFRSAETQGQWEREVEQFACELRSGGNAAAADKLELKLSIVPIRGKSDSGNIPLGTEDINGRAIHLSQPSYPFRALSTHASGTVKIRVIINEAGEVNFACVLSGHQFLQAAAKQAALESRFTPTIRNGKAVRVAGTIIYHFQLPSGGRW